MSKLEIEHRHSDYGEDAGGYSVLRFNGDWVGRVSDSKVAQDLVREFERLQSMEKSSDAPDRRVE